VSVAEHLLRPPDRWTDELNTLPIENLPLSCHPRLADRLPSGRTLSDVENDLARGAWLVRRRGGTDVYSLGGTEFQLRVKSRLAENGRHPIAQVLDVDEARSVPRRVGWLAPRLVRFHDLWDEEFCDLGALEAELAQRVALTDARGRPAPQPELEQHHELHRSATREYGNLGILIGLLEHRPVEPERTIAGQVVGGGRRGRQQVVIVETGGRDLAEFRGKRVRLRLSDGRAFNTRVTRVHERLLDIVEPQDWPGKTGDPVEVAGLPPFGLRRNGQALDDFLRGRVEGAWQDLARLLCRPADLTLPPLAPPRTFYCDVDADAHPLNVEQRRAVTGAVASPHAFLVQGPPGTGKTEVISETIQQLVGRGERVLLLAPAHVAVDEVLKRVGPKSGMRPLRITFDDDKVDESVRAYLPQNVGVELVNRVLRPTGPGRAERWGAELDVVERQLSALTSARSIEERLTAVRVLVESSSRQAAEISAELANLRSQRGDDLQRAGAELAAAQQRYDEAKATDVRLADVATTIRVRWEPLLADIAAAARELSTAVIAQPEWDVRASNAEREYQKQHHAHAEVLDRHDVGIRQLDWKIINRRRLLAEATAAEASAAQELQHEETVRGTLGQVAGRVGLGQVARARRALIHARSAVEQQRTDLEDAEKQLREAIGRRNVADARGTGWLVQLRDTAERNRQRARSAAAQLDQALLRVLDLLSEYNDAPARAAPTVVPAELTGDTASDACGQLAAAVLRVAQAVTPPVRMAGLDLRVRPNAFSGVLVGFVEKAGELWYAESTRPDAQRAFLDAEVQLTARRAEWQSLDSVRTARLERLERGELHARTLLDRHQAEATELGAALATASGELRALDVDVDSADLVRLERRRLALTHLPALESRWRELVAEQTDDQLVEDIQTSALRATNLVCATTKGIVGRGSDVVRDTDYDTLIVDEASRVTDSEFLIGAVRARRWVLVGDEHQLPPHVDQEDEHFLHALFALYRHHRGAAASLDEAVAELAGYWKEDTELREFRSEAVRDLATELVENGQWETMFLTRMAETYERFAKRAKADRARQEEPELVDPDRELLRTMNQYLVRSLLERVVTSRADNLTQRLEWQRRMPEPLARIVNVPVYGGAYKSPPDEELAKAGARPFVVPTTFDRPVVFVDTSRYRKAAEDSPAKRNNGFVNDLEQQMVLKVCRLYHDELDRTKSPRITASVLSFYRAQARALDDALDRSAFPLLDIQLVDVIDRIQGQQSDLVVISFVRAREGGAIGPRFGSWLQDVRRLNVACTRARRALVFVGHADTLRRLGRKRDGTTRDENAEPAVTFYKNLFELFDGSAPEFLMLHKLGQGRAG
jgi:hypothetical protein